MIALWLVLLPLAALPLLGAPAIRARAERLLVAVALAEAALALWLAVVHGDVAAGGGLVRLDATARLFVGAIDPIFAGIAIYVRHRLQSAPALRADQPRFCALALLFLAAANGVLVADDLMVGWIALEASTLAAAPLVVRPGEPGSRRASWHYLLFSTVGLGLCLLGFLCLQRGMAGAGDGHAVAFALDALRAAPAADASPWTRLGLVLAVLGLGTKLGLAPMHGWLPETYDEAPAAVGAMLGAVQWNCAFVLLLRVLAVWQHQHAELLKVLLVTMGLGSMLVSTCSIVVTRNLKRLIAYASINHAGVLAIGLGIGPQASYGVLLYALSNAFIKAILFLTAGQIKARYRQKDTRRIAGLLRDLPYSGLALMLGTFALLGLPPFGSFFGELLILTAVVSAGHLMVFGGFCVLITVTFVATGRTVFPMIWGERQEPRAWPPQRLLPSSPKLAFLAALVVLGLWIPSAVDALLHQVAATLEAR